MRIQITGGGIYASNGSEIPVGTELDVKGEPTAWAGRYTVIGKTEGKTAVTAPAAPAGKLEAREKGAGWWAIYDADGKEVGKALRKDDAEAFNGLSDEDKAEFVKEEA